MGFRPGCGGGSLLRLRGLCWGHAHLKVKIKHTKGNASATSPAQGTRTAHARSHGASKTRWEGEHLVCSPCGKGAMQLLPSREVVHGAWAGGAAVALVYIELIIAFWKKIKGFLKYFCIFLTTAGPFNGGRSVALADVCGALARSGSVQWPLGRRPSLRWQHLPAP